MWTRYGLLEKERIAFNLRNQFAANSYRLLLLNTQKGAITRSFDTTSVNIANDSITIGSHGLETGVRATFSASGTGATLPGGIDSTTAYYVVKRNNNEISLVETFSDFLITLGEIATSSTLTKLVNITSVGTGNFTLTVRPQVGSDDFMTHAVMWECDSAGYERKNISISEPTFGNPNNRVNFPAISVTINAGTTDIQYTHIALAADATSSTGNSQGILLGVEYTGALQTIPAGFGFSFIVSLASPAVAFNTVGIN